MNIGGAPTTTNNGSYSNEQHYSPQTTATGPNSGSGSGTGPGTGLGTGRITGTAPGSSSSSQVSGSNTNVSPNPSHDSRSTTPLPTRNRLRSQSTNPWIQLLHIKDEHTRTTLQQRYLELEEVDARLMELQKSRLAMESAAKTLEIYAAKEALNVSITNDKLEEFTYF
ncbi:uncharacterized protein KQ657_005215 [Scheffersomyces spartinae]|uniref:Transcription regulator LGE1 helical region domain-containing protein n=1 Tax=Scheffersomyces spartinae TaxID=45513 RepID=A0A9P7VAG7_9ASCO|nr:uncharacterized protein KQ657_005215 [Scheffersomyces spartinae]KAG7194016.1 hypothetical protein KQ657_005215 [Scheffersomyces spartinae]